jgi:hypothetical protein
LGDNDHAGELIFSMLDRQTSLVSDEIARSTGGWGLGEQAAGEARLHEGLDVVAGVAGQCILTYQTSPATWMQCMNHCKTPQSVSA